jgi:hypothetical protein
MMTHNKATHSPDLNPLDFYLWGYLNPLGILLLLTMERQFTIALWMPVKPSAITLASLNEGGGP